MNEDQIRQDEMVEKAVKYVLIRELVLKLPNDQELGAEIRRIINENN
jgi:hypothetical protein|tara:strand:+ start:372 stop:512 length:141 start_codon:yes stop_codon:yes gene_type:complete